MKTVLVVEDEKLIRQGIKNMIQRSGVPVEMVIECNNGEAALEILQEKKVDVMFTDIRMPKMDGIELVQRMQCLDHLPITVVISGYDDFSYAVEMLRQGVREYILKPVDRNQITEILQKCNEELEKIKEEENTQKKLNLQQLKYLCQAKDMPGEEKELIYKQCSKDFLQEEYLVCCCNGQMEEEEQNLACISLGTIGEHQIYILNSSNKSFLLKSELHNCNVGFSARTKGIEHLQEAYAQAVHMRKLAFARKTKVMEWSDADTLSDNSAELSLQRKQQIETAVNVLGTQRMKETASMISDWVVQVQENRLTIYEFELIMQAFICEVAKHYQQVLKVSEDDILQLKHMYQYQTITDYRNTLLEWTMQFHELITEEFDDYRNKQKIQQALAYMHEHFHEDLNMAVVSNYISMNYSLFSYAFKQYTGSNFVSYLKELRVQEAKRLLEETDMRVIEISQRVGYENEKHFMKTFKALCGVSPSEYRKNSLLKR